MQVHSHQPRGYKSQNVTEGGCLKSLQGNQQLRVKMGKLRLGEGNAFIHCFNQCASSSTGGQALGTSQCVEETDVTHAVAVPFDRCRGRHRQELWEHEGDTSLTM